jgi:hypothetical protein
MAGVIERLRGFGAVLLVGCANLPRERTESEWLGSESGTGVDAERA